MKTTMTAGVLLASAFLGCHAPSARTTPVLSSGVQASVGGVYCALPERTEDDYKAALTTGELGAKLRIENTTDTVATVDLKKVSIIVNGDISAPELRPWPDGKAYEVPPHSTRAFRMHVYGDHIRCNEVQTVDLGHGVFLGGQPLALVPLKVNAG
jgi:hypothetical protein